MSRITGKAGAVGATPAQTIPPALLYGVNAYWRHAMAIMARIMANRAGIKVENKVGITGDVGATNMEDIYLGSILIQTFVEYMNNGEPEKAVASLKGVVLHEAGHIAKSPGIYSPHWSWVTGCGDPVVGVVASSIEEGRMESLFVMDFPASVPYFQWILSEFVLGQAATQAAPGEEAALMFLLCYGRRWLSRAIRDQVCNDLVLHLSAAAVDRAKEIINWYAGYDFDNQSQFQSRMIELAQIFSKLIPADTQCVLSGGAPQPINGAVQHQDGQGSGMSASQMDDAVKDAMEGAGQGQEEGEGSGAGGQEAGEETPAPGGKEAGSGSTGGALGQIQKDAAKAAGSDQVKADTAALTNNVSEIKQRWTAQGILPSNLDRIQWMDDKPDGSTLKDASDLTQVFQILRDQAEAGWVNGNHGKIDVQRWIQNQMRPGSVEDLFHAWEPDQFDDVKFEAVLLFDRSGSMCDHIELVENAVWEIKRVATTFGQPCAVMAFDYGSYVLYERDEPASPGVLRRSGAGGGTDPVDGLEESANILGRSARPLRLFIMLSDGEWSGKNDQYLAALDKIKSTSYSALFSLDGAAALIAQELGRLPFDYVEEITSPAQITGFFTNALTQMMAAQLGTGRDGW